MNATQLLFVGSHFEGFSFVEFLGTRRFYFLENLELPKQSDSVSSGWYFLHF